MRRESTYFTIFECPTFRVFQPWSSCGALPPHRPGNAFVAAVELLPTSSFATIVVNSAFIAIFELRANYQCLFLSFISCQE